MAKLSMSLSAETTEREYKREVEFKKPKSWLKTVSAFSNGIGGTIYFGVNDDKEIIGIDNTQCDIEKISELIKTRIEPLANFKITVINQHNKDIIKLEIIQGTKTPYYYVGDGNKIVYVRIGNESVNAPTYIINELIAKGEKLTFDAMTSKYNFEDLSFSHFKATYLQKTAKRLEESDFISFGLMTEQRKLTYAGVLFSDQCPLLQSRIFCTRWNGLEKTSIFEDAVDDREYSGNLIMLLENGFNFIKNHNRKAWKKLPRTRIEYNDYNERAITEILVNALIHRMYDIMGTEIHIDIYDDRLEIWSPGGMYDGSSIQNKSILEIPSKRRNPIIADVFQRLGYMERRGSGLKKIFEAINDEEKFKFYSDISGFKVTLINENYNRKIDANNNKNCTENYTENCTENYIEDLNKTQKKIIKLIEKNPNITQKILCEKTNLTRSAITLNLKQLKEKNIIERIGSDRKGIWKIINK